MKPNFDTAWRRKALAGEEASVQVLADAALVPLYRFCLYRLGRNRHLCEEVVQETLLEALRRLRDYDPARAGDNIFPWLIGLARNHIQRVLHREKAAVSLEALWERMDKQLLEIYARLDCDPFSDELLERQETCQMVNIAMSQIPPHYREALEAKYIEGRSVREIAVAGSMTEKAAESLLGRAREAFRATFIALAGNLKVENIA